MDYFKKVLPEKKQKLVEVYSLILTYLKKAQKGVKSNNVEETQWWFGDIFTTMCENKEIIDPVIYKKIVDLKNDLVKGTSQFCFSTLAFKCAKRLDDRFV